MSRCRRSALALVLKVEKIGEKAFALLAAVTIVAGVLAPVMGSVRARAPFLRDRKSTRLNSSHLVISYAVFCLKKKKKINILNPFELRSYPKSVFSQSRCGQRGNVSV